MPTSRDMPPPATKGGGVRNRISDIAPDPNANRDDDYPNEWRIEHNKQTAKCNVCGNSQAGTKWCVTCTSCNKRMCSPCWKGERFNRYGEAIFEGKAQNDEGCWCRFNNKTDPSYQAAFEARSQRTKAAIAAEKVSQTLEGESPYEPPAAKRQKLEPADDDDDDMEVDEPTPRGRRSDYPQVLESPDDWNPRRRCSAEDSVQQDGLRALPRELRSNLQDRHLHNKRTIIVGAGVIGLSIARELAARTYHGAMNHPIVVVEKRARHAVEATGGQCAGLITKHSVPEVCGPLLELSLKCWHEQLADKEFRNEAHYVPNSIVHVKPKAEGRSDHTTKPPAWYNMQPEDVFKSYGSDVGKINTKQLTALLYGQCLDMGVTFRYEQEIRRIEKSMRGQLQAVDIHSSRAGNNNETNVVCHNIIVAAGAETPEALDNIVTWLEPKTTFENHKQSYEWARAPLGGDVLDGAAGLEDVSVIIRGDNITGVGKGKGKANETPSSSSFSILTAEPKTNTILAATFGNSTPTQHFKDVPGVDMEHVKKQTFSEAEKLARAYIRGGETAIHTAAAASTAAAPDNKVDRTNETTTTNKAKTKPILPKSGSGSGSTTISTAFNHRPLIDMIPWHVVDPRTKETVAEDKIKTRLLGIYVAYGFGRHGTTLAPGVARIVVSKMVGGKEDAAAGEAFRWPEGFDGEE